MPDKTDMFGFLHATCSGCSSREHSVYRAHFCGLRAKLDDEVADRRLGPSGFAFRGFRGMLARPISQAERTLRQRQFPVSAPVDPVCCCDGCDCGSADCCDGAGGCFDCGCDSCCDCS
ncbi:MAG: hypothetical protein PF795_07190 [Kiritimatiellae bacterium]|nr:hypothetical protein [Kiritimatiellia bacterium]